MVDIQSIDSLSTIPGESPGGWQTKSSSFSVINSYDCSVYIDIVPGLISKSLVGMRIYCGMPALHVLTASFRKTNYTLLAHMQASLIRMLTVVWGVTILADGVTI